MKPQPPTCKAVFDLLADYFESPAEAIRFMRAFAGIVLRLPPMPAVERLARDHQIATALSADPTTGTVRRLAGIHSVPMRTIAKSFSKSTGRGLKNVRLKRAKSAGNQASAQRTIAPTPGSTWLGR